jgi:hypothetical protein
MSQTSFQLPRRGMKVVEHVSVGATNDNCQHFRSMNDHSTALLLHSSDHVVDPTYQSIFCHRIPIYELGTVLIFCTGGN